MNSIELRHYVFAITIGLMSSLGIAPALSADDPAANSLISVPADSVFASITAAWRGENEKLLADLVHPDGLRVTHGGDYDRFTIYSPDQAFYYFQDLFRSRSTIEFKFRRLTDDAEREQSLAMVEWEYLLPGRENSVESKLVVVLALKDRQWRMAQLNSISQR